MPYSKRTKSPSPGRDTGSAVQVPPPVPKKRGSQYMTVGQHFNSTNDRDKTPPVMENSEAGRAHGTKPSGKLHFDSTSHIYANQTPPIAMPRLRSSTVASSGMSPSSRRLPWQPLRSRLPWQPCSSLSLSLSLLFDNTLASVG